MIYSRISVSEYWRIHSRSPGFSGSISSVFLSWSPVYGPWRSHTPCPGWILVCDLAEVFLFLSWETVSWNGSHPWFHYHCGERRPRKTNWSLSASVCWGPDASAVDFECPLLEWSFGSRRKCWPVLSSAVASLCHAAVSSQAAPSLNTCPCLVGMRMFLFVQFR